MSKKSQKRLVSLQSPIDIRTISIKPEQQNYNQNDPQSNFNYQVLKSSQKTCMVINIIESKRETDKTAKIGHINNLNYKCQQPTQIYNQKYVEKTSQNTQIQKQQLTKESNKFQQQVNENKYKVDPQFKRSKKNPPYPNHLQKNSNQNRITSNNYTRNLATDINKKFNQLIEIQKQFTFKQKFYNGNAYPRETLIEILEELAKEDQIKWFQLIIKDIVDQYLNDDNQQMVYFITSLLYSKVSLIPNIKFVIDQEFQQSELYSQTIDQSKETQQLVKDLKNKIDSFGKNILICKLYYHGRINSKYELNEFFKKCKDHLIDKRILKIILDWILEEYEGNIQLDGITTRQEKQYTYRQIIYDLINNKDLFPTNSTGCNNKKIDFSKNQQQYKQHENTISNQTFYNSIQELQQIDNNNNVSLGIQYNFVNTTQGRDPLSDNLTQDFQNQQSSYNKITYYYNYNEEFNNQYYFQQNIDDQNLSQSSIPKQNLSSSQKSLQQQNSQIINEYNPNFNKQMMEQQALISNYPFQQNQQEIYNQQVKQNLFQHEQQLQSQLEDQIEFDKQQRIKNYQQNNEIYGIHSLQYLNQQFDQHNQINEYNEEIYFQEYLGQRQYSNNQQGSYKEEQLEIKDYSSNEILKLRQSFNYFNSLDQSQSNNQNSTKIQTNDKENYVDDYFENNNQISINEIQFSNDQNDQ